MYLILAYAQLIRLELSIAPQYNSKLVPQHMKSVLAAQGLDIDNLVPMSPQEMMVRLE